MNLRKMIQSEEMIQHLEDELLDVDSEFRFKCNQCGRCCINQDTIILNPVDIFNIQMLNGCILCPSYRRQFRLPIYGCARRIWKWVRESGLKLTTSELIRLEELGTQPSPELLGDAGRQALTETIYNHTNILDGALEMEMERSPARDVTVTAILKLLRTHRLLLI